MAIEKEGHLPAIEELMASYLERIYETKKKSMHLTPAIIAEQMGFKTQGAVTSANTSDTFL